jgi:hypothetical protein
MIGSEVNLCYFERLLSVLLIQAKSLRLIE